MHVVVLIKAVLVFKLSLKGCTVVRKVDNYCSISTKLIGPTSL